MLKSVLVANRGEIAARVLRTCRELGIRGIAVYSEPDAGALHVRVADEAHALGGKTAPESYLDQQKLIDIALATGAEAIHPGYGFLAENAEFAQRVEDSGLIFIGPPAQAIQVMGEKVAARAIAEEAGVPQVPGTRALSTPEEVKAFGSIHGYPLAIKASYGGGGRGMRTVFNETDVDEALESAQREALAAFGRGDVYVERYLSQARHVEVQIFADKLGNVVWLGDRDCSIQRRHQKLVEEAPAPGLSQELRTAMGEAAVRLAKNVGYVGAGTIEYLVEADREAFYFLEMNTRIQVEHPVTELTLGMDLIAEQLRVASGQPLSITESGPAPRGHAIEVRVNAEDVAGAAFRPSPGPLAVLSVPNSVGVRFDSGYEAGDEVLPYYDSMVGKLIVWAPTREHAIDRLLACIEATTILGIPTTLPAAQVVLGHEDFRAGRMTTRWLENDIDIARLLPEQESVQVATAFDEPNVRDVVYVGGREYIIPPFIAQTAAGNPPEGKGRATRRSSSSSPKPNGRKATGGGSGRVTSPMQGTVVKLAVTEGQQVEAGEIILVLEAMKMENPVKASIAGTVVAITAEVGQVVSAGTPLVEIKAP